MLNRSREWVSYLKTTKEFISIHTRNHLSFWGAAPAPSSSDLNTRFLSVEKLTTLAYSAPIANKETLHERIFYAYETFRNRPLTFEMLWKSMIRRVHVRIYTGGEKSVHLLGTVAW